MIPSHWFRRIILIVFIMEVAGGILWVTGRLSTNPAAKPMTQALGSLIFLFGFLRQRAIIGALPCSATVAGCCASRAFGKDSGNRP